MTLLHTCLVLECKHLEQYMENMPSENSPVEVAAVFIECDLDGSKNYPESGTTRFEREQLFKHNALRDCNKKLAVTVKMTNEPTGSGDEYVPIDHVLDGSNKRRVRLLHPYVLRLRRDTPLQAYKLRLIDTVSGFLASSDEDKPEVLQDFVKPSNRERDADNTPYYEEWTEAAPAQSGPSFEQRARSGTARLRLARAPLPRAASYNHDVVQDCGLKLFSTTHRTVQTTQWPPPATQSRTAARRALVSAYTLPAECSEAQNVTVFENNPKRVKRQQHEQNIIIEEELMDKHTLRGETNSLYNDDHGISVRSTVRGSVNDNFHKSHMRGNLKDTWQYAIAHETSARNDDNDNDNSETIDEPENIKIHQNENGKSDFITSKHKDRSPVLNPKSDDVVGNDVNDLEKEFALYEIGNPDLWFKVHVQMFEKLTTDKGNTLWNDITKGQLVSVSSMFPEWSGPDVNVQYRPADLIPREDFTLPITSLCLLVPLLGDNIDIIPNKNKNSPRTDNDKNYIIVVPAEDILCVDKTGKVKHSILKVSVENTTNTRRRRVVIQVARALWTVMDDSPNIATHNTDKYLTLLHRKPHRAQVDLEVRADENQLVRVGSSGRVAIVVADSTRRARSTIAVQATNTGLAAARFRAEINECDSGLLSLVREKQSEGVVAGPVLLPPRHTRRLLLQIPLELPNELHHCSVNLVNDDDEAVAVREVIIRKGDRCFCVWHCDCVCYGESPKLRCQEMSAARQAAAGLAPRRAARCARSACYADTMPLNIIVIIIGVIMALLFFGLMKALIGLVVPCIGAWGLDRVLEAPRTIARYYERDLQQRPVQYDDEGWPVHPDTLKRTVRVISRPMEFVLNVLFFVVTPGLVMLDLLKQVARRKRSAGGSGVTQTENTNTKKIYSSHDLQKREPRARRKRKGLHKWMTPHAEELSANVWHKDLTLGMSQCESMLPLLHEGRVGAGAGPAHSSCSDSEPEDTAFVLMHMQKSTESLARSQKKLFASGASSVGHQMKHQTQFGLSQPDSVIRKEY